MQSERWGSISSSGRVTMTNATGRACLIIWSAWCVCVCVCVLFCCLFARFLIGRRAGEKVFRRRAASSLRAPVLRRTSATFPIDAICRPLDTHPDLDVLMHRCGRQLANDNLLIMTHSDPRVAAPRRWLSCRSHLLSKLGRCGQLWPRTKSKNVIHSVNPFFPHSNPSENDSSNP